jgi:hypothetical protein
VLEEILTSDIIDGKVIGDVDGEGRDKLRKGWEE